jgi:hypothetical protein
MSRLRSVLLLVLALAPAAACARSESKMMAGAEPASGLGLTRQAMSESSDSSMNVAGERMIIRYASLTLEVGDVDEAQAKLKIRLPEYRGYISNVNTEVEKSTTVTYRIDSKRLDEFVAEAKELGHVEREFTSSHDVTEQYVDTEARLKNLHMLRDRIRALLDKATDVEDLLKIERELARVQSEIDAYEAQQKTLKQSVDLAEVTVTFEAKTIYGPLGYVAKGVGWVVEKLFVIRR